MRRLDAAIPVGHQALSAVTNLRVRKSVQVNIVFLTGVFSSKNTSARRAYPALKESKRIVKVRF